MNVKKNNDNDQKLLQLRQSMVIGYTSIIVFVIIFFSVLVMNKTDDVLRNKVGTMASALTMQMKILVFQKMMLQKQIL